MFTFFMFNNAIFADDGLIFVSCFSEYFSVQILFDHTHMGVCTKHFDRHGIVWPEFFALS